MLNTQSSFEMEIEYLISSELVKYPDLNVMNLWNGKHVLGEVLNLSKVLNSALVTLTSELKTRNSEIGIMVST